MLPSYDAPGGITAANRERLSALHRAVTGPFTAEDAARILTLSRDRTLRLLAYLASRGWLTRVRRNLYITVPLEASGPNDWREDPWIVAAKTFAPCYIGGWSAGEHWGLTDQIFRDIMVYSAHPVRSRVSQIQGTSFIVKVVPEEKLFGTAAVWRSHTRVQVSDASRTIADMLDDPSVCGGIRHVAEVLAAYFETTMRDDDLLVDYLERIGNRSAFKRLGYLVEQLGIEAPLLIEACVAHKSLGFTLLEPSAPRRGRFLRRWNLQVNATIDSADVV